jgi:hypothetical protein
VRVLPVPDGAHKANVDTGATPDGGRRLLDLSRISPDFSSYFAEELAVRGKRQITKGIGNEEAVE